MNNLSTGQSFSGLDDSPIYGINGIVLGKVFIIHSTALTKAEYFAGIKAHKSNGEVHIIGIQNVHENALRKCCKIKIR